MPGRRSITSRREKVSPTRPSRRSLWKRLPSIGDDAGGFLAAMLQRVQAERRDGGGIGVAENAEHAALFAQRVPFEVVLESRSRLGAEFEIELGVTGRGFASRPLRLSGVKPLATWFAHLAAGFSISFFRPSRAGLL